MKLGYDLYCIEEEELLTLLKYTKQKKLRIYHLRKKDECYFFYTASLQSFLWRDCQIPMEYIKTVGIFKYFLYLRGVQSMMVISGFIIGLLCFTHMIFFVDIQGTIPTLNKDISLYLSQNNINTFYLLNDYEELNDLLVKMKDRYREKVEYLNIYQKGSVFFVEYTKKQQDTLEENDFKNIYAAKDGMIESFDIDSGNVVVKRLDYVKKGDLLVENSLVATDDTVKIIPVKGHVYAYTFNQYEASINNTDQDQSSAFYHLLLLIRSQIPTDAKISKENVLQIERTRSKIILKMHYTLLEDIAVKKEN